MHKHHNRRQRGPGAIAAKNSRAAASLDALLKLRQACCDPPLLKLRRSGAKVRRPGSTA